MSLPGRTPTVCLQAIPLDGDCFDLCCQRHPGTLDQKQSVLLVLLDLSATFDTVDHSLLLNHLATRTELDGKAHEWVTSYLSNRTQSVSMNGINSPLPQLNRGVPQGSVLGPIFFTIWMQPLGDIVRIHGLKYHLYADDTQLYLTFDHSNQTTKQSTTNSMEVCINEIKAWMLSNKLKLNNGKTEFLYFHPHHKKALDALSPPSRWQWHHWYLM